MLIIFARLRLPYVVIQIYGYIHRARFVAILLLALAAIINFGVNICHVLSYYFLELLPF
jgi:hypothetical protein